MTGTNNLIEGYKRFKNGFSKENAELLTNLAKGQSPKVALVSCCDSRVEPAIILDCNPGEIFTIRNVANLVPPKQDTDDYHGACAALEYAVTALGVESIVVMGHSSCGGIKFLIDTPPSKHSNSFVSNWMKQMEVVRDKVLSNPQFQTNEEKYTAGEHFGILQSLENLMALPWVKERVESGNLSLHGWYYDLYGAKLYSFEDKEKEFLPMD